MAETHKPEAERAAELARRLLGALENERQVERFVNAYVAEFDRPGLMTHPHRYRELLATLGREALLVMLAQVGIALPPYVTPRRPPLLRRHDLRAADAFGEQLLAS